MRIKIIQILNHSASWKSNNLEDDIFDGWHVRTAKAIQKSRIKDTQIECWIPEKTYSRETQIEKDGIIYKTFPSKSIGYGREISWSMINAIRDESKSSILLHLHGIFNYTTYLIASRFSHLPVVAQHHGDCPPLNLLQRRTSLYFMLPLLELEHSFITKSISSIDYFFCLSETIQQSLRYLSIKNKSSIQGMGVNFEEFITGKKIEARKALNLPIESKILLFIGQLDRYKGSDKLIEAYQILKNKYNLSLVIVGASELDEYYKRAIRCGAIIFPRQPHKNLQQFYQSADIFVMPGSMQYNHWGGIGINTIESLACNAPVITGTLSHFPQSIDKIGVLASKSSDIISAVEYILKNNKNFNTCREIARTYYDWQIIANITFLTYKRLFKKYYNITLEKTNV